MHRPRLVHVTTVPDALIFLRDQVGFMKQRGFDVTVVSSPGAGLEAFARREGVVSRAVPMTRSITPLRDLVALGRLIGTISGLRPDIVHAHTPKGALLGIVAATALRVPVRIYHLHGLPLTTTRGARRLLLAAAERVTCALSTHVLCVGYSLRRKAIDENLVDPDKIRVVCAGSINGVDAAGRFNPSKVGADTAKRFRADHGIPEDAVVYTFVGRLVRDKGIEDLAEAFRAISRVLPNAHLVLAGRIEPQDPVSDTVLEWLRSAPGVTMLGFVEDPAPLYAATDVVVLPTYREGFPTVPLEASAMNLPVIATRVVGAVDAVLDGLTGMLVPPRQPELLGRAMLEYGRDPELRARHGSAGRRRALQEFAPEPIWRELGLLYDRALESHTPRLGGVPVRTPVERVPLSDVAHTCVEGRG